MSNLGELRKLIRKETKEQNVTLSNLSKTSGVSMSVIQRIFNEFMIYIPKEETIEKIFGALNINEPVEKFNIPTKKKVKAWGKR